VIRERVTTEGEQNIVAPLGVVRGGVVQRDRDERMNILHVDGLDVDVGDDGNLVVIVRQSSVTGGGQGWHRRRRLDQGHRGVGFLGEEGSCALLLLQKRGGGKEPGAGGVVLLLRVGGGSDHDVKFLLELSGLGSLAGIVDSHWRWCHGTQGGGA
jgi:hypothetical protein